MQRTVVQQQLLSYYCSQGKKHIKNGKLNLFGKGIIVIDILKLGKQIIESIVELDLSHNSIYRLENLNQFCNLQILNISHNQILQISELAHLMELKRLTKVSMKKNPFLQSKIPQSQHQLISSFSTDISCLSEDIQKKLDETLKQCVELQCFLNYEKKVKMHIQLINTVQTQTTVMNPSIAMFPKIKKILEIFAKEIQLRRWYVGKIKRQLFYDQKSLLNFLDKELEKMKQARSIAVRNIYEFQDALKQDRGKFIQQNVVKTKQQIVIADMNERRGVNEKMRNVAFKLKKNQQTKQNSPHQRSLQARDFKDDLSLQKNLVNILVKVNPLYHLLHSPIPSLKSHEKDLLIKGLLSFSKDKMIEIGKYQQSQKDHTTLQNDFLSLQQHMEWITIEVKKEQQLTKEKYLKLQAQYQQQVTKIEEMTIELANSKQKLRSMNQENDKLKSHLKNQQTFQQEREQEEDRCQLIQNAREKRLVRKYFGMFSQKAAKLYKLNTYRSLNKKVEEREIQYFVFNELKKITIQNKQEKQLNQKILTKYSLLFFNVMKNDLNQFKNCNLCKIIRKKHGFMNLNTQYHFLILQKNQMKLKQCQLFSLIHQKVKNICSLMFNNLRRDLSKGNIDSELSKIKKKLLVTKYFRTWVRYSNENIQKSEEGISQIKKNIKIFSFNLLQERCKQEINFNVNVYAFSSFLLTYRKITNYLNFTKSTGSVLLSRQIKTLKVKKLNQYRYLQHFIKTMRDKRLKKKIKNDIEVKELQIKRQEALKIKQKDQQRRKKIRYRFRNTFFKASCLILQKILKRQKMIFNIGKERQMKKLLGFFSNLQSYCFMKAKLSFQKQLIKKSIIYSRPLKMFFTNLSQNRSNIATLKKVQHSKLYSIYFYRWKAFAFWTRMNTYKTKFQSLEPQIAKISLLQGQLKQQKSLLLEQLKDKQLMIQAYIKKCEQYEYTLHSKSLKYDKLKEIYAQSVQLRELNNTIKFCDSANSFRNKTLERNQDIYKKYLPISGISGIEDFDSMRTPIQKIMEPEKQERMEDVFEKEGYLNEPFIQTFRKF